MSAVALAQAVRDVIQARIQINGKNPDATVCEVGLSGMPKPGSGQVYIAVHLGGWQPVSGDYDLEEEYTVRVTVTVRLGSTPTDRHGLAVWVAATAGLDAICRAIVQALHQNQQVRLFANSGKSYSIGDSGPSTPDGFYTTVQFTGAEPPQPQRASWFLAGESPDPDNAAELALSGVSQTLSFGKARRCQTVAGMT